MLDSLGNIMVMIATGLVVLVVGFFVLAMLNEWLNGKAGKPFLSFGVCRSSFCRWRGAYRKHGAAGPINKPTIPKWHANRTLI